MIRSSDVHVYLIKALSGAPDGPVKVGVASSPEKRMANLRTASPFKLELIHIFPFQNREIAMEMETCFHELQADHRATGEWFFIPPVEALRLLARTIEGAYRIRMPGYPDLPVLLRMSGVDSAWEKLSALGIVRPMETV